VSNAAESWERSVSANCSICKQTLGLWLGNGYVECSAQAAWRAVSKETSPAGSVTGEAEILS
jgi:hypothetical protein